MVVKGILEGQRGQTSPILFFINQFRSFLFFRKDPYFYEEKEVSPSALESDKVTTS